MLDITLQCLESLRKHPPILFMSRICTEDDKFPYPEREDGNEITITKGTPVIIPVRAIHHDPKFYPEPDKFDPSRFNDESKESIPNCCFLGFGDGPRVCLGKKQFYIITEVS